MVERGFDPLFADIRLFPAPALESVAHALVGITGAALLFQNRPGLVLIWFLLANAIVRFGIEGLRGDERGGWLGLSVPRWMCVIQTGVALNLGAPVRWPANAVLLGALLAGLIWGRLTNLRRHLLAPEHIAEIRNILAKPHARMEAYRTSRGMLLSVSPASTGLHVALSMAGERRDLMMLCEVGAAAVPGVDPALAQFVGGPALHLVANLSPSAEPVSPPALYTAVLRQWLHRQAAQPTSIGATPWYYTARSRPAR